MVVLSPIKLTLSCHSASTSSHVLLEATVASLGPKKITGLPQESSELLGNPIPSPLLLRSAPSRLHPILGIIWEQNEAMWGSQPCGDSECRMNLERSFLFPHVISHLIPHRFSPSSALFSVALYLVLVWQGWLHSKGAFCKVWPPEFWLQDMVEEQPTGCLLTSTRMHGTCILAHLHPPHTHTLNK